MPQANFELGCDRLSQIVDGAIFERLRWSRNEGPMLAKLVALAQSSLEGREEFELADEGSTTNVKRFVLKVHHIRTIAITICLKDGQADVSAAEIDRSQYRLSKSDSLSANFAAVDEQWMACTLNELFNRVQS